MQAFILRDLLRQYRPVGFQRSKFAAQRICCRACGFQFAVSLFNFTGFPFRLAAAFVLLRLVTQCLQRRLRLLKLHAHFGGKIVPFQQRFELLQPGLFPALPGFQSFCIISQALLFLAAISLQKGQFILIFAQNR